MKNALSLLVSSLLFSSLSGQTVYEPQIAILIPKNVRYDTGFKKEIEDLNRQLMGHEPERWPGSEEIQKQPANIRMMMANDMELSKNMDLFKQVSWGAGQFLIYKFFEQFPNLLILVKDIRSDGKPDELKRIAEDAQLQYVLNFPDLSFYKENDISYARLGVQLYDHSTGSLLIDTSYIGDWNNPGFEFACQVGSLQCTINNSLSQALDDVIHQVAANSPTLKKERSLWQLRLQVLRGNYYGRAFDGSFIAPIIPANDSTIVRGDLYQLLVNEDKTKFVGFFLTRKPKKGLKDLNDDHQDKDVTILNGRDIKEAGSLDVPQTYAYIVKAVKYQGKWYYEKSDVTYFEPEDDQGGRLEYFNNLQDWGFFKDNSTVADPDFWETHLFKKIRDLRKDPDWEKYGDNIWKAEEEENRKYIGLYEIVADQLKGKKSFGPTRVTIH